MFTGTMCMMGRRQPEVPFAYISVLVSYPQSREQAITEARIVVKQLFLFAVGVLTFYFMSSIL